MIMDIDKDFIRGLGIPPDGITPKRKVDDDTVETNENAEMVSAKSIAETPDEAILAMEESPLISETTTDAPEIEESASIVVETEKAFTPEKTDESASPTPISDESLERLSSIGDSISKLLEDVAGIKASMARFEGYDKAVETLKRSLAANQRNEENIYKELETYKKNQYYNYIRPFLDFLINLLTDLISSLKQYEDDQEDFTESHGQEMYNEIINLHKYYVQQIESQLEIQGVEIRHYECGTPFIATEQIISKTIPTDDSRLSGTVGKVDSACYKFEDKILKKAKVQVYKCKPADNK